MQPTTTQDFLDALKFRLNLRSDYACAKLLGVTTVTMMRWRAGGSFNDSNAMHVADLLKLPRAYVLACMGAQRAEDTESSGVWRQIADVFRDKVALWACTALLGFMVLASDRAPAAPTPELRNNVYYGKRRRVVREGRGKPLTDSEVRRASLCIS